MHNIRIYVLGILIFLICIYTLSYVNCSRNVYENFSDVPNVLVEYTMQPNQTSPVFTESENVICEKDNSTLTPNSSWTPEPSMFTRQKLASGFHTHGHMYAPKGITLNRSLRRDRYIRKAKNGDNLHYLNDSPYFFK